MPRVFGLARAYGKGLLWPEVGGQGVCNQLYMLFNGPSHIFYRQPTQPSHRLIC